MLLNWVYPFGKERSAVLFEPIRLSSGTASRVGLLPETSKDPSTTAYFMTGEKCRRACSFCSQGLSSTGRSDRLGRILWPAFKEEEAVTAVAQAMENGTVGRACFQVVNANGALEQTERALIPLMDSDKKVSITADLYSMEQVDRFMALGVDQVALALDAASERVSQTTKGGGFATRLALLEAAARKYPKRVTTHLIVGLGETEEEMARLIAHLLSLQVTVALFAFTPIAGTPDATKKPPQMGHYRRMQAVHYLLLQEKIMKSDLTFVEGRLQLDWCHFQEELQTGHAFQTTGCMDCNRPFYNERPGHVPYNYPRPLTADEGRTAFLALFS